MRRAPIGIELFCGCGGLSTGFLDAGIRIAAGFDIDRRAIEAYEYNHRYRGSRGIVIDLATASGADLLRASGLSSVDILIGGPPCQPFSIVGKRLGERDERAQLLFRFLRFLRDLRPSAFVFENVPNLMRIDAGRLFERLLKELKRQGYSVTTEILCAADFGVPQGRKRLVVIGALTRNPIRMPAPTHQPLDFHPKRCHVTSRSALEDLPPAADFGECGTYNHEPTQHTPHMLLRFAGLTPGKREAGSFHDRLHPEKPSFTLRAGSGNFSPLRPVHYRYDRVITVRESARLQGFTDTFIWPDWIPRLQQYRQVGNAVPPPLARSIAESLAAQLKWTLKPKDLEGNPAKRPNPIILTDQERKARRLSLIRGASLGRARRGA